MILILRWAVWSGRGAFGRGCSRLMLTGLSSFHLSWFRFGHTEWKLIIFDMLTDPLLLGDILDLKAWLNPGIACLAQKPWQRHFRPWWASGMWRLSSPTTPTSPTPLHPPIPSTWEQLQLLSWVLARYRTRLCVMLCLLHRFYLTMERWQNLKDVSWKAPPPCIGVHIVLIPMSWALPSKVAIAPSSGHYLK